MGTPPRPLLIETEVAIERIHDRHERVDDPRRAELGTDPG